MIRIRAGGNAGALVSMNFLVDTGFNGLVSITDAQVREFRLKKGPRKYATTPAGRKAFRICQLWIQFDSLPLPVTAYISEGLPSVGTGFLEGKRLEMDVVRNGTFTIVAR